MRTEQRGFTLIELMTVLAVIGVLSAIAIPMFGHAADKARHSEVDLELSRLAKNAKAAFVFDGTFPQGTATVLPGADGTACANANHKFAMTYAWQSDLIWQKLDFGLDGPTLFSYHYTSTDSHSATISAVADIHCDGHLETQTITVTNP
jgi:prepilin-type N-terminal cleavage/methylation domain-containing protein